MCPNARRVLNNNAYCVQSKVSKCEHCRGTITHSPKALPDSTQNLESRVDPVLHRAQERVRELELELAQTKLAHVEAECRNQVCMSGITRRKFFLNIKYEFEGRVSAYIY